MTTLLEDYQEKYDKENSILQDIIINTYRKLRTGKMTISTMIFQAEKIKLQTYRVDNANELLQDEANKVTVISTPKLYAEDLE